MSPKQCALATWYHRDAAELLVRSHNAEQFRGMIYVFIGANCCLTYVVCEELSGRNPVYKALRDKNAIGPVVFLVILFAALLIATMATLVVRIGLFQSLDVSEVYWSVSGKRVERAKVGELVTGHVVLYSRERFDGDIVLRIKVDVKLWLDKDVVTERLYLALRPGESRDFTLGFKPAQASAGSITGYFIEVDFGFSQGKWTMPPSYPPRLVVSV